MISKTKISKRIRRKTDPVIEETIILAKKNKCWMKIAQIISGSKRGYAAVNLKEIDENSSEGDTLVIPGKVLGLGEVTKRVRVCALEFSESAKDKLVKTKSEIVYLLEEIKKNPKAEGVKILR